MSDMCNCAQTVAKKGQRGFFLVLLCSPDLKVFKGEKILSKNKGKVLSEWLWMKKALPM